MLKLLRRSLLFVLMTGLGLLAGVLIRFWAGSGLAWKDRASGSGDGMAAAGRDTSGSASASPPASGDLQGQAARNQALVRLRAIAAKDFDTLAAEMAAALDDAMGGAYAGDEVLNHMLEIDPARTLAWLRENHLNALTYQTWHRWQKKDASTAEAWAKANDPDLLRRLALEPPPAIVQEELARMMKEDPAALERLLETPGFHRADYLVKIMNLKLADSPSAAFAWAEGLKRPADRASAVQRALQEWAKTDPKAAAAAWSKLPQGQAKAAALDQVARALPAEDSVNWLKDQGSSPLVQRAMAEALGRMSDPAKRAELLKHLTNPASGEPDKEALALYGKSLQEQARRSGSVVEMLAAMEEGAKLGSALEHADDAYAKDPAATLAAIGKFPNEQSRREALAQIAIFLANTPDSDIEATLAALPKGELHDATAACFADIVSRSDPERAAQMALGLQSSWFRTEALKGVLNRFHERDPDQAAAIWNSLPAEEQTALAPKFAETLSRNPDEKNMALLATLPYVPAETVASATETWLGTAPDAASTWANTLPPGPNRDAAARSIARGLLMDEWDPANAVTWAASIEDEAQRQATLRSAVSLWTLRDPAAAAAAVANLPPADQAALQNATPDSSTP